MPGGVSTFPATWDELKTAADSLRAAGEIPLMFGGKDDWQNYDMFITIMGTVNKSFATIFSRPRATGRMRMS